MCPINTVNRSVSPFVVGDNFGDSWYELGFSSFRSLDPSLLARSTGGKETEKSLDWTVWRERNIVAFDNEIFSAHRMKHSFICSLWYWSC